MALYKHINQLWNSPKESLGEIWKNRLIEWRRGQTSTRIDYPTRLDRAKSLGYKASKGMFIIRHRILRGGHQREWKGGRKSSNQRNALVMEQNYQHIAERRVAENYPNCEVINSYYVGRDGKHYWYEIILADRTHPAILADKNTAWLNNQANKNRVFRGLTSAAKKSRGLRWKGKGAEKARPSRAVTASAKGERHNRSPKFMR